MEIRPIADPAPLDRAIEELRDYEWLVFTSSNGVRFFMERLEGSGRDMRALGHLQIAAIGPVTAETLGEFHLRADLVPESYRSESLAAALLQKAKGRKVLLARADRGRTLLKDELQQVAEVAQVAVYHHADVESLPDDLVGRIVSGTVDWITITSSAIVMQLHALLPPAARQRVGRDVRLASLSPVTSETASRLGWDVAVEAREYTWEGLVHSLVERVTADRQRSR